MATLSDVARLAHVSLSTASRALNGSRDRVVKPELAARVVEAAHHLNYSPNAAAQAMARGHSMTLGLIVHDIRDPYFSSIAAGVMREAGRRGYVVTLATTFHDKDTLLTLIDTMRQQRTAALILAGSLWDDPDYTARLKDSITTFQTTASPHVSFIGQSHLGVNSVTIKNRSGAQGLGQALSAQGFATAAILSGQPTHLTSVKRSLGFSQGFSGQITARIHSDFTREGGYQGMKTLVESGTLPDVVFAVNDVMAVGALAAAREASLSVPGDIAVAGFDDIPTLADVTPSLTTVRVPLEHLGEAAVDLAFAESGSSPEVVSVSTTVVLRDSTARAL